MENTTPFHQNRSHANTLLTRRGKKSSNNPFKCGWPTLPRESPVPWETEQFGKTNPDAVHIHLHILTYVISLELQGPNTSHQLNWTWQTTRNLWSKSEQSALGSCNLVSVECSIWNTNKLCHGKMGTKDSSRYKGMDVNAGVFLASKRMSPSHLIYSGKILAQ